MSGESTPVKLTIRQKKTQCKGTDLVTCTGNLVIVYKKGNDKTKIRMKPLSIIVDSSEVSLPYTNGYVTIKRITSLFTLVYSPSFEILYDLNGRVYIRLSPDFAGKVS